MPGYTLTQLFMGTALISIIVAFSQTEGCGARYANIESLCFTSDDSRILASKLTSRDACTPFKIHKADVARTVSWIDAQAGSSIEVIHQSFKSGNCGPAFELWHLGRTSALCTTTNDVAIAAFGGGEVTRDAGTVKPPVLPFRSSACNIAYSKDGRFLAASGRDEVAVFDTQNNVFAMRVTASGLPFLGASLMSFTDDDSRIVVAGDSGVQLWDISTSKRVSVVVQGLEPWINAVVIASDHDLVVCSDVWVRRYDFTGRVATTLAKSGAYLCCVARDGNTLATYGDGKLSIYDLNSNKVLHSLLFRGATALALSSGGDRLAVGDYAGHVALFDTTTGARRWYCDPPGRHRWPWTVPAAALVAWTFAAWRLSKGKLAGDLSQRSSTPIAKGLASD